MNFLTDEQLRGIRPGTEFVYDIECFKNFLFIGFKQVGEPNYMVFWADQNRQLNVDLLRWFICQFKIIGFNSNNYDILIMSLALVEPRLEAIKMCNDVIINDDVRQYDFKNRFGADIVQCNHVDLYEVCPLRASLKMYGARLHAKKIQDMPTKPSTFLTDDEKAGIGDYCLNDLELTELLYVELSEQMTLREKMSDDYGIDLRSKSDAQIAERVMSSELYKITHQRVNKPHIAPGHAFKYDPPEWMEFCTPELQKLLEDIREANFIVNANGGVEMPLCLKNRSVKIGKGVYRLGIGGLHSSEKCQAVIPDDDHILVDRDVASYYPSIILNEGLYPEHLGETFLEVYRSIVERRLTAKKAGNKPDSNSLKIVINGLFGKFGSKFSIVYSPKLLIQVTVTGQLALLMLIEYAESEGIRVVNANTDGMVFLIPNDRKEEVDEMVGNWEAHTGFVTEETPYKALYSRDVNNYIAVKEDGKAKTKGAFLLPQGIFRFHKNPDCNIISHSVIEYLTKGIPVEQTITECEDITQFLIARNVKGGADFCGEKIGKSVRWYYGRFSKESITYVESGNLVPRSEGAVPCQQLPEAFPPDVDHQVYINQAQKVLIEIGAAEEYDPQCYLFPTAVLFE